MRKFFPIIFIILVISILLILRSHKAIAPTGDQQLSINHQLSPINLFFAGDIMLSRNVHDKIYKAGDFVLPFKNVMAQISQADISFANLESPFNDTGSHFVPNSLVFNADPSSIEGLTLAGFDILSTANNHSFDQSARGFEYTLKHLKDNNILPVGTGSDCHQGQILEKNRIKFGFLAYSYAAYNDGGKTPNPLVCDWNDPIQVAKDIQSLKAQSDFLIVSAHMGTEYKRQPDENNVTNANAAVDAGADLVVGHHPHWIQTIEKYKDKWIFYSLGNFVFDQMWSQDTREGLTVTITFNNNEITKLELKPIIIENYCCPRWANEEESLAILKQIGLTSSILVDNN